MENIKQYKKYRSIYIPNKNNSNGNSITNNPNLFQIKETICVFNSLL